MPNSETNQQKRLVYGSWEFVNNTMSFKKTINNNNGTNIMIILFSTSHMSWDQLYCGHRDPCETMKHPTFQDLRFKPAYIRKKIQLNDDDKLAREDKER